MGSNLGAQKTKRKLIKKYGGVDAYRKHLSDIGKRGAEISNARWHKHESDMWPEQPLELAPYHKKSWLRRILHR